MISTARQFGNIFGVALLLAIYGHAAFAGTEATVAKAAEYVASQEQLSPALKDQTIRLVEENFAREGAAAAASGGFFDPAAGLSLELAGSAAPDTVESIRVGLYAIAREEMGRSYMRPFLVAAFFSILGLPLALLLGRRLGDHRAPEG